MASNRGVVYQGPGKVEVQSIDFPKMRAPNGKDIDHGVILKIVSTNICGSDQHMVRGRTTAPVGLVLGHESPARSSRRDRMSKPSPSATSSPCRSTWHAGGAARVVSNRQASA
jgi:hypothetical protein